MDHLKQFIPRPLLPLSAVESAGWLLKRYAILAGGRTLDTDVVSAATQDALRRLPRPGPLEDSAGNHGVGFQIVHFAEVAIVSPVFYWQWGSVLARIGQRRAAWVDPMTFKDGVEEVVGCIWEMNIVLHETRAWQDAMLGPTGGNQETLQTYLNDMAGPS